MSLKSARQREQGQHLALGEVAVVRGEGRRTLLHALEHRRLGLARQPVVLVDEDDVGHQLARLEHQLPRAVGLLDDRLVAEDVLGHVRRQSLDSLELGVDGHRAGADEVGLAGARRPPEHHVGLAQQLALAQLVGVGQQGEERPRQDAGGIVEAVEPLGRLLLEPLNHLVGPVEVDYARRLHGHESVLLSLRCRCAGGSPVIRPTSLTRPLRRLRRPHGRLLHADVVKRAPKCLRTAAPRQGEPALARVGPDPRSPRARGNRPVHPRPGERRRRLRRRANQPSGESAPPRAGDAVPEGAGAWRGNRRLRLRLPPNQPCQESAPFYGADS